MLLAKADNNHLKGRISNKATDYFQKDLFPQVHAHGYFQGMLLVCKAQCSCL